MLFRSLFLTALGGLVAFTPGAAAAASNTASEAGELPPELAALLAGRPTWSSSAALQLGGGYKDNLLLSPASREESAFVRYGLEAFVWRLPRGGTDFSAFLNTEQTRYLAGRTIDDEAQAFAHLEWRYRIGEAWKIALGMQGYYLDQVFDVSDTDIRRVVAELKVKGATAGPTVRWAFRPSWWLEAKAIAKREKYDDHENDSQAAEAAVQLGWIRRRVEITLGAEQHRRRFDRRLQYSTGGLPLDDTRLIVTEKEGEMRFGLTWDEAARWKSTLRASALQYDDNGSGFFDYRERKLAHEVEWNGAGWMVALEGSAKRIDFDVQTVGFGISPPARIRDEYAARVRVERKFSDRWLGYIEYKWERNRSNDRLASYRVNEGLLGARWSWER